MITYLGDFAEDETVYLMFNTFTSDDPSASSTITNFINTDVHIHKDDGLAQRNNAAGITVSIDFDGITGSHMIKIDTSDDTVGGFWVTGSDYFVRIEGTTVDGATINAVVGHFSIENRYTRGTDSAGLASVTGALTDVAAVGEVTETDTLMQYLKQLINILIGTAGIGAFPSEAAPANAVSLAEVIRAIHADVTGLNGDAMRGTNSANTVVPDAAGTAPTAVEIQTEMEENGESILDAISDLLPASTIAAATDIPAMVGTNNAALASVCTEARLAELAAANLPTDVDGIKSKTDNLPADPASETNVNANETKIDSLQTDVTAIKAKTDNQPAGIPKNVALDDFEFLMIDSTDHISPKTGLTVTVTISKDGGAFAGSTNSVTEVGSGVYKISFTQTEQNASVMTWKMTAAGADQRTITVITST